MGQLITKVFATFLAAAIGHLALSSESHAASPKRIILDFPSTGAIVGGGWDVLAGVRTSGTCVSGRSVPYPGNSSISQFSWVYDDENLAISASIRSEAEAKFKYFGASSTFNLSASSTTFRSATNILSTTVVDKGGVLWTGNELVQLTDAAKKLYSTNYAQFRKLCGDGYVSSIRNGGRLNVLFELAVNRREVSATVGYDSAANFMSMAKAKFKLDASATQTENDSRISARAFQSGGKLITPTSAVNALALIETYPNFPDGTLPHPFEIEITPYPEIVDKEDGVSAQIINLQQLAWTLRRLHSLALVYDESLINKRKYYQPFYENDESLALAANIIRSAIDCGTVLEQVCSKEKKCESDALIQRINTSATCNSDQLSDSHKGLALKLLFNDTSLFNNLVKNAPQQKTKSFRSADVNTKLKDKADSDIVEHRDIAENFDSGAVFYYFDVRSPLLKKPLDQFANIKKFCAENYSQAECDTDLHADVIGGKAIGDERSKAVGIFREWILLEKIMPVSRSFCEQSMSHKMCYTVAQLKLIVDTLPVYFGPAHGFESPPAPVIAPAPAPPKPVKPSRCSEGFMKPTDPCH